MDDATDAEFEEPETADDDVDRLVGVVTGGLIGAAGGFVGVSMMVVVLLLAESLGAFSRESFMVLSGLVRLDSTVPALTIGFLVFLFEGVVPWPLLFASLKGYLPGSTDAVRGVVFGTVLWTGFVVVFYEGYTGTTLLLYLGLTLVAHWVYGFGLGVSFHYLTTQPEQLV